MRIAVIGTGALACVFSAHLAAHADLVMLGTWPEGVRALADGGVQVTDPDGRTWRAAVSVSDDPTTTGVVDFALVLVKSYQTERAARWARQVLREDGLALTLQNGLDNYPALIRELGPERAAAGVTYTAATMLGPGRVRHVASNTTYLGIEPHVPGRVQALADLLNAAGLAAHAVEGIGGRLWGKAVANAAINPLTALGRVTNGALLDSPDRQALLAMLAREAAAVAGAAGVTLPFEDPVAYVESVCRNTAANRSSMLQDVEAGRRTEIDSINGIIAAVGKAHGVEVCANEVVWRLVRALARR
jgi:2-dehydropantoate 2-reductase